MQAAKICNLVCSFHADDVLRFDIAVDEVALVDSSESFGHIKRDIYELIEFNMRLHVHPVPEWACAELEDDVHALVELPTWGREYLFA